MSVRTELVQELQQQLLGPRQGINELLVDPHREYMTGVLAPVTDPLTASPVRDVDTDADSLVGDAAEDSEDDENPVGITVPTGLAPALDPASQPRSLGISFVVHSDTTPTLQICATWARYERQAAQRGANCFRRPKFFLTGEIEASDHWKVSPPGTDITLQMRCILLEPNLYRVSVFFLNTRQQNGVFAEPEDFVFQPQIRICLTGASQLQSIIRPRGKTDDPDEDSLELLYQERNAMARGHLCAAVWRKIDPERPLSDGSSSPFTWCDAEIVPEPEREPFLSPDLRTEFLPLYPVISPSPDWRTTEFVATPELSAIRLAESYDPVQLAASLEPLPAAYRDWIDSLKSAVVPAAFKGTAAEHIRLCEEAATRIETAIALLVNHDDARLAFCFANRAIHEQNDWRRRTFEWRPFQLGFFLLALAGLVDRTSPERELCDLLWFPTGGGKTEAYLGLMAFTLGLRRLRAPKDQEGQAVETGLGVLSRYTLRLLTIQQFRRALGTITACELLRVLPSDSGRIGWRPYDCPETNDYLWGATRFSAGLWTGKNVAPNDLYSYTFRKPDGTLGAAVGALDILQGKSGEGEPAQVLTCPCCETVLAIPQPTQDPRAYPGGKELELHLVLYLEKGTLTPPVPSSLNTADMGVKSLSIQALPTSGFYVLSLKLEGLGAGFSAREIDRWWDDQLQPALGGKKVILESARASHPGYFIRRGRTAQNKLVAVDFEVYCPSPECRLAKTQWREKMPIPIQATAIPGNLQSWQSVVEPFASDSDVTVGTRVPIPALTVDNQIYRRPPSLLVATVDKFARLAFTPEAAALFGNVTHFKKHLVNDKSYYGYTREGTTPGLVRPLDWIIPPPDLVLQDELHLIDGPLGSMVGLYETAIDGLCEDAKGVRPKYIASTATVRQAPEQIRALFNRGLFQFPPRGLNADDSFFALTKEVHPAEQLSESGRLYMGFAAPGKGAQTPIVRTWSVLLQAVEDARQRGVPPNQLDPFWTLVGYFNAIRELAGAAGLFRQDIRQRVQFIAEGRPQRDLSDEAVELSSRADSLILPTLLEQLGNTLQSGAAETAALATSMFGTGVDVARLGLMVVHGQPKSTSSYIQATGRVGRSGGGLVVTFLRASRPRDLDHYEFFTGYHRQLYRSVEPVTVAPFSPRARERAIGPLCMLLLRQARHIRGNAVSNAWKENDMAPRMESHRFDAEVAALLDLFEERAQIQPDGRRPLVDVTRDDTGSELDIWHALASRHHGLLKYFEYALNTPPAHPVVLGDPQHQRNNLDVAYENAPQSLREVEATTGFKV